MMSGFARPFSGSFKLGLAQKEVGRRRERGSAMPEREEGRESHSRHGHSRPAREPSPKRSRRDGRPEIERKPFSAHNSENVDNADRERRHRRHLSDAVPIETKLASQSKRPEVEKPSDQKLDGVLDGTKDSSNPAEIPQSRLYFQHDDHGSAGQSGRGYARRHTERGRLSDFKEGMTGRPEDKVASHDMQKKEERKQTRPAEDGSWRHDGFFELEAEATPSRKRPAFTEKKLLPDEGNDADMKRDEQGAHNMHRIEKRHERWVDRRERLGSRPARRVESQWREFASRDRFGSTSRFPGRDGFSHRNNEINQNRRTTGHAEKWKHDLFDEANRSPPPRNEEDQIAKVEALLAL